MSDAAPMPRELPDRTIELLKQKGFSISKDFSRASYKGQIEIEITWPEGEDTLELCFVLKRGKDISGTLYAKPSGVLLAAADRAEVDHDDHDV